MQSLLPYQFPIISLNPYSNGIYSMSLKKLIGIECESSSLNPYSNGICSMISKKFASGVHASVLILILMEYAL